MTDRDPISWDVARSIAVRVAGREPFAESYHYPTLQQDFDELTAEAETLVTKETGLQSLAGPARARVTDRAGWVDANLASFQRLLRPVLQRFGPVLSASPLAPITRSMAGAEVGALLGWMSTRVLGQYDLLLIEDEQPEEQDLVYYVGPNILALEKRYGFPPRQFRLWLALHEVTHRVQFTGVPWMRPYFLSLVESNLATLDLDPRRVLQGIRRAVEDIRAGRNPLDDSGVVGLVAGDEQHAVLQKVQGLMSLLEGHGDVVMSRAASPLIPEADRFHRVLHERRTAVRGPARVLQQLLGLEAKLRQYEMGEQFIDHIEKLGGRTLLDLVWTSPEMLPTLPEIRQPQMWVDRVDGLERTA